MDTNSVISFIRIMRTYPQFANDRKKFKRKVDSIGEEAFTEQKKRLRENIDIQKKEIMECFDKYQELVKDGIDSGILNDDAARDALIDKLIDAFFPKKEKTEDDPKD